MKLIWILTCATFLVVNCARIEKNGYKEVTISFSAKSQREDFDFAKLKVVLTEASNLLFNATRKRSYFEEFVLVIPPTWTNTDAICDGDATTVPKNIDIYVTESSDDPTVTTRHSKGCGHKGDIIYVPVNWLKAEDLALQFVQQWSIFRYGVFLENPESSDSCVATSDSTWSPVGCFNVDLNVDVQFDENSGLPLCKFPKDQKVIEKLRSSIMFSDANTSKILDFCDGSEALPHNPISPTLHNRICEGKAVWSVIKNTDDFKYGRNSPRSDVKTPPNSPIFSCFKETKTHITLVMQDSNLEGRNEIRYSLFHFLSIMEPTDFAVRLATFSNDSLTESTDTVEINLEEGKKIKSLLDSQLTLNLEVPNICLICGLRKAYKVSANARSQFSRRIIILFAQESSLKNTTTSTLVDILQKDADVVLYLVFLEDTTTDIIPLSLEEAVQNTGGKVFRVKNKPVYMLTEINVALLDATGDKLKIEDKILVVHKKVYANVRSDFRDSFLTPRATKGRLYYSLQCETRGDIKSMNDSCTDKDANLQSPVCGNEADVTADNDSGNKWQYEFEFRGNKGKTCLSLALLKLQSSSTAPFTVKGWLNNNKIIPGQDVLIVYAEIFGKMDQNVEVEAKIFGPGPTEFGLQLRDNGNGDPDVIKGDNIYSRYFTSFTHEGIYTVSIYVKTQVADANSYFTEESEAFATTQMKTIGTFTVMQPPPREDIYPPNRVSDLTVVAINKTSRMVQLQWTAPGDDYDHGTATKYVIKLSEHWSTLMDIAFNLKENAILETDNYTLSDSGSNQIVTVSCPLSNGNRTYYIALRAMDDNNNEGTISNIVQVHLPPVDGLKTSTEKPVGTDSPSSFPTEESINATSSDDNNVNTTAVLNPETKDGIFIEKSIIIISASSFIAFIVLLIIFNIIICCCCVRKKRTKESKISRKDSLRPPYNINMAYKRGSETSFEEENRNSNSLNALGHPKSNYSSSDETSLHGKRYSYHTTNSLRNKMNTQNRKNDLGFKIVEPKSLVEPPYATSSLTRFAAKYNRPDPENETNAVPLQELSNNAGGTQVYSLGQV